MAEELSKSPATSSSTALSSPGSSSVLLECVRLVVTTAGAVVLCAMGKFPPELALVVLTGNALPADPLGAIRRLLQGGRDGR